MAVTISLLRLYKNLGDCFFSNNELYELNEFKLASRLHDDRAIGQEKIRLIRIIRCSKKALLTC